MLYQDVQEHSRQRLPSVCQYAQCLPWCLALSRCSMKFVQNERWSDSSPSDLLVIYLVIYPWPLTFLLPFFSSSLSLYVKFSILVSLKSHLGSFQKNIFAWSAVQKFWVNGPAVGPGHRCFWKQTPWWSLNGGPAYTSLLSSGLSLTYSLKILFVCFFLFLCSVTPIDIICPSASTTRKHKGIHMVRGFSPVDSYVFLATSLEQQDLRFFRSAQSGRALQKAVLPTRMSMTPASWARLYLATPGSWPIRMHGRTVSSRRIAGRPRTEAAIIRARQACT